ncbi:MAG: FtsX-like permease family protein [Saccharofermentans sp.]|nr:FtsX-like permease family protein [Saccharofermentans sp.]
MGRILLKRAFRDLKAGWARYLALSLLIIFSIFIVTSLMGAAVTVIDYTELRDRELVREDGEFSVFVPLRSEEIERIRAKGVTIEEMFYADYPLDKEQVLRVFKLRENINRISLIEGRLPQSDDEAVLERRFSEVNGININDKVKIGDREFRICGVGAVPDYNTVIKKVTDSVVDSRYFGLLFVTPDSYDALYLSGAFLSSEEYYYSYLLNGTIEEDELKNMLEDIEFDVNDVDDEYFREYWDRMTGRKDELLEGIDELSDGAKELSDGAKELSDGVKDFHGGMTEFHDAVSELADGIEALDKGAAALEKGVRAYTAGVDRAAGGASELVKGAKDLKDGSEKFQKAASDYSGGLKIFSGYVGKMAKSSDPALSKAAKDLDKRLSGLVTIFDQLEGGIDGLCKGSKALAAGSVQLSDGLGALSRNSTVLNDGAKALHDGTKKFKKNLPDLTDGADELYDGSGKILDGSEELAKGAKELSDGVSEFAEKADDLVDEVFNIKTSNLILFLDYKENPRIDSAADDVKINYSASIIFGILLVMLFAYVISVFIVHMIDQESSVIGALYSMGVRRRTLIISYVAVPVIVTFISGIIGTTAALLTPAGIEAQLMDSLLYYSMPALEIKVTPFIIIYGLVIPPVTAFAVNMLVIRKKLKRSPLSLLRNEQKIVRGKELKLKGLKFLSMFRIRQMVREIRAGLTVVLGMFMALLVAFMALNTYVYCQRVKDYYVSQTHYEYMYNYKYPAEEVPEGGYAAVAEGLKKDIYGYSFDVTVMGITKENPFFDTGDLPENGTDVVVSSAVANKYNLSTGDEFTLKGENGDRLYAFRVSRITDYSASLMIFMDIDRCRELFDEDDDYFNTVFSDHELNIDSGRLYSVVSKSEIARSAGIYVDLMQSMIITMSVASAVVFVVVMYLMIKMMIDRSAFNISLVKIFGFRNREVRKMYIDGNFYIVAIGALIVIPLSKLIMDYIYPRYLVSNVGVGIRPDYSPEMYLVIFAVIIGLYLLINLVLTNRIRKIKPAEILKNRE